MTSKSIIRCPWCGTTDELYIRYHDTEWGIPIHDDRKLFEMLTLEGAQAGLSWITILRKRENYGKLFHHWDIPKIATMIDDELENILFDTGVVRNRLKIFSVRKNAQAALQIQKEYGSLDAYFWSFVSMNTEIHHGSHMADFPTKNHTSDMISKDLKKRGMSFVGSTIIYAFLQAVGIVDDHIDTCSFKKIL
jgi:DNA-3-methyladenine glycosylase I